jgi:hypothetical protein
LNEYSSLKASYNRTHQYIQLASNSTSATPLDIWFPATENVKPQRADQVALGYFRNLKDNTYETSLEVYYKKMFNAIDFRDHAQLLLNQYLEAELRIGTAYSYGLEAFVKKQRGDLTGWISYTYSKTNRTIPEINNGKEYSAPYDKTHDVSVILSYDLNKQLNFSANWVYSTAPPRTMPTGRFEYGGMTAPVYSDRNTVRIFDYHRGDLSCTYTPDIKKRRERKGKAPRTDGMFAKYESSWNLSIYNVYVRKNPMTINFDRDSDTGEIKAEIIYLFKMVPSITYNFNF